MKNKEIRKKKNQQLKKKLQKGMKVPMKKIIKKEYVYICLKRDNIFNYKL